MKIRRLPSRQQFVIIAAVLMTAVFATGITFRHSLAAAWAQATTHQASHYTSLAFLDTGNLPTYAPAGRVQHISFRIANHETAPVSYQYHVLLSTGATATLLKADTVALADGQAVDLTVDFTIPNPNATGQIVVQLTGRPEYITFEVKS